MANRNEDNKVNGNCTVRIQFHREVFASASLGRLEELAKQFGGVVTKPYVSPVDKKVIMAEFLNRLCARGYYSGAMDEYCDNIQSGEFFPKQY